MSLILPRYAWVGNAENTPFPIVDPKTGEEAPIWKGNHEERLHEEHPEWAGAAQLLRHIRVLTGNNLIDLSRVAVSENGEKKELIERVRRQILFTTAPLRDLPPAVAEKLLAQYGRIVNTVWLNDIVKKYFAGLEHDFDQKNEVYACNDPARLLVMAFNTRLDPRVRYEARRKLALMKLVLNLEHYDAEEVDHDHALSDFFEFLNCEILDHREGEKIGAGKERFLVSTHDVKRDHKTLSAAIQEKEPRHSGSNRKVTPVQMRRMVVRDESGRGREIWFHITSRDKGTASRLIKDLRYGTEIGEKDGDRNGLRMVFERTEDADDFFRKIKKRFTGEVNITTERDNLNGTKKLLSSHGGNPQLPVRECKVTLQKNGGKRQFFDCQIFLPAGLADYLYRRGMSWKEYEVSRFFEPYRDPDSGTEYAGVHETLCPVVIYGHRDRRALAEERRSRAFRTLWDKNGIAR